jgi:hypothetical protein
MSVGTVGLLVPEPVRMPSRTTGPRLRLVASQGLLYPDEGVGPGRRGYVRAPASMRLTRRGRLVITLMVTVAVAMLAVALASSVDAAAPQIDHATTVSLGQTLSEVAAVQLPSLPIRDAVARLQLANGLNTSQVHAGQLLLIPSLP